MECLFRHSTNFDLFILGFSIQRVHSFWKILDFVTLSVTTPCQILDADTLVDTVSDTL